jgi:hypothetical protein
MKTSIAASLALSALLAAATSVCADPIFSSSSSEASATSLRGSATRSSRDLQLSPQNAMECYIQGQDKGYEESVACTAALLATCSASYMCAGDYYGAQREGYGSCHTWAQWPVKSDNGGTDDRYEDDGQKDCIYAVSCCTASS